MTRTILALDPATSCGWALCSSDGLTSGVWDLGDGIDGGPVSSAVAYWHALHGQLEATEYDVVAYEQGFHRGAASRYLGGLQTVIMLHAFSRKRQFMSVHNSTIKAHVRRATGTKELTKNIIHAAAIDRWGDVRTNDEADALWLLDYYLAHEREIRK